MPTPTTYAGRAMNSYDTQAKALSTAAREGRRYDRRTPGASTRNENEKQSFADVLNEVSGSKQRS